MLRNFNVRPERPLVYSRGQSPLLKCIKTISPERVKEITTQSFPNTICIQRSISGEINKILFSFTPSGLILFLFLRPGASPLAMCFLPFGHRLCIRILASGSSIHGGISLCHNVFVAPSCRRPNSIVFFADLLFLIIS